MNHRLTSDSAKTVSLFPFLAVLLCTMGALLVLLVVLAQRAGERIMLEAQVDASAPTMPVKPAQVSRQDAEAAEQLVLELEQVRAYQKVLAELRQQAEQRLLDQQNRLSHLEQHTRELEEELARLFLASEQLKATEENRSVDQQQAERELARLQKLIEETESQLEVLRKENSGKKSYAIVPYRGPNGTYRKPIYIECCKDGIIIHPEGIRLRASDFRVPTWAGNPLAAALRATREHVNAAAARAGAPQPPDPYPVILVRPDGIPQYSVARAAITSWDASFGYEFIDADWNLEFPEGPDPALARDQEHAIMLARDRLARLIRSAPSRFQGTRYGGGGSATGQAASGTHGDGFGAGGAADSGAALGRAGEDGAANGNGVAANASAPDSTAAAGASDGGGEAQIGALAGSGEAGSNNGEIGAEASEAGAEFGEPGDANASAGERYAEAAGQAGGGGAAAGNAAGSSGEQSGSSSGSAGQATRSGSARMAGASGQLASIADAKGRNWAVKNGGPKSVAIRRPIQVVVRENQLAMLPSRHALDGEAATGRVISLNQPMAQISDELVTALRARVNEWGLAGSGLYWRPVLKLNVGPDAEQTATQIMRLLKDSGVEVSLPETARASQGGTNNATR
ncbi:MAG: hypothetical protein ACR2NM_08205 [Bythopirellula sp.]